MHTCSPSSCCCWDQPGPQRHADVQDLLHGPHTAARSDTALTSLAVSPPAEGRKAGKAAARQTGLSAFYKSEPGLLLPHTPAVTACLSAADVVEGGSAQVQMMSTSGSRAADVGDTHTMRHPHGPKCARW